MEEGLKDKVPPVKAVPKVRRTITPATLLKHINEALEATDLTEAAPIKDLVDYLKDQVVAEAMKG